MLFSKVKPHLPDDVFNFYYWMPSCLIQTDKVVAFPEDTLKKCYGKRETRRHFCHESKF